MAPGKKQHRSGREAGRQPAEVKIIGNTSCGKVIMAASGGVAGCAYCNKPTGFIATVKGTDEKLGVCESNKTCQTEVSNKLNHAFSTKARRERNLAQQGAAAYA